MIKGNVIHSTQNLVVKSQRIAKIKIVFYCKIKSSTETLNKLLL